MIFIIISNIGLALMTLLLYMRYSHFRISYGNKIKELSRTLKEEREKTKVTQSKLESDYAKENDQVKTLLREIEQSRKERQEEIRLRLEAEKEIEVSKEKILQVQKRVQDWKTLQEGAINDSKSVIMQFGQDLLAEIRKSQSEEEGKTRDLFTKNNQLMEKNVNTLHDEIGGVDSKIVDFRKRIASIMKQGGGGSVNPSAKKSSNNEKELEVDIDLDDEEEVTKEVKTVEKPKNVKLDEVAQKAMKEVVSLIEADDSFKHMRDYIVSSKLDEKKAKYMLCDLFLLAKETGYFIDFKADRYFVDYHKRDPKVDEKVAVEALKKRLDKYIAYISNPKYSSLIQKLLTALKINVDDIKIVFAVKSHDDTSLLNKIGYTQKIEKLGVEIMDVNAINDLILL